MPACTGPSRAAGSSSGRGRSTRSADPREARERPSAALPSPRAPSRASLAPGERRLLPPLVDVAAGRPIARQPLRQELRDVHDLVPVPLLAGLPFVLVVQASEVR